MSDCAASFGGLARASASTAQDVLEDERTALVRCTAGVPRQLRLVARDLQGNATSTNLHRWAASLHAAEAEAIAAAKADAEAQGDATSASDRPESISAQLAGRALAWAARARPARRTLSCRRTTRTAARAARRWHVPADAASSDGLGGGIAFVIAPIVTNGSELMASYTFALKKTSSSIVCSFEQLLGAAVMNRDDISQWLRAPEVLKENYANGLPDGELPRGMPNLGLSERTISDLVAYLETLGEKPSAEILAATEVE